MYQRRAPRKLRSRRPRPPVNTTIRPENYDYLINLIDVQKANMARVLDGALDRVREQDAEEALVIPMTPVVQKIIDAYYRRQGASAPEEPEEIIINYALAYHNSLLDQEK